MMNVELETDKRGLYNYILTHGLNCRPAAMQRWAQDLALPSERCELIRLPGHAAEESFREVTAEQWLESFSRQYAAATQARASVYIGYSLGGLIMTHSLGAGRVEAPAKQVLLAPALAFNPWSKLPAWLPESPLDRWVIRSASPSRYKVRAGVTIRAYKALFAIREELEQFDPARYNIPTLVLCDRYDELVNPAGLAAFIQEKRLTNWRIKILESSRWRGLGKKHLLIGQEFQSPEYRHKLRTAIRDFLYE